MTEYVRERERKEKRESEGGELALDCFCLVGEKIFMGNFYVEASNAAGMGDVAKNEGTWFFFFREKKRKNKNISELGSIPIVSLFKL